MGPVLRASASALPFIEIALFGVMAWQFGVAVTLLFVVMSAVLGAVLIRLLGNAMLAQVRLALVRRESPEEAVFDAACVLMAGVLFIIPGILTDLLALLILLLRPLRHAIGIQMWRRVAKSPYPPPKPAVVIDAEFSDVPEPPAPRAPSRPAPGRAEPAPPPRVEAPPPKPPPRPEPRPEPPTIDMPKLEPTADAPVPRLGKPTRSRRKPPPPT